MRLKKLIGRKLMCGFRVFAVMIAAMVFTACDENGGETAVMTDPPAKVSTTEDVSNYIGAIWGRLPADWQQAILEHAGADSYGALDEEKLEVLLKDWDIVKTMVNAAKAGKSRADYEQYPEDIVNAVYGGLNPGDTWVTVSFRADNKVVCAFSCDNSSSEWEFGYEAGEGTITTGSSWSPGEFEIKLSGSVLIFTDFGSPGAAKVFSRLRGPDLADEAGPAGLEALPGNLAGSVWGGSTPASDGTAFLTITFRAKYTGSGYSETWMTGDNVAVISYSHDNTTAVWDYSYDSAGRTGTGFTNGHTHDGAAAEWNPGGYTISEDGNTMTFGNFGGHAGERKFNRYAQLVTADTAPDDGGSSGSNTGETGITVALPGDPTGGITISSDRESWPDGVTRSSPENVHILEASDKTCDDYHWFVDGEQAIIYNSAETPPRTYQFKLTGGNYSTGRHKLVLAVVKNGIPYSVEVEFTVN